MGLRLFFAQYGVEWALLMAAATMFTLPMIIVFFFSQRTFIKGIGFTGAKAERPLKPRLHRPAKTCHRSGAGMSQPASAQNPQAQLVN